MLNLLRQKQCRIQFMSDLHLERIEYQVDMQRSAPIIILGGDSGRYCDFEADASVLREQCVKFDKVLRTRADCLEHDIHVLGCTLQSHVGPDCGRLINDFSCILIGQSRSTMQNTV